MNGKPLKLQVFTEEDKAIVRKAKYAEVRAIVLKFDDGEFMVSCWADEVAEESLDEIEYWAYLE